MPRGFASHQPEPHRPLPIRGPVSVLENLIRAGALEGLGRARRALPWELGGLIYSEEGLDIRMPVEPVALPHLSTSRVHHHGR